MSPVERAKALGWKKVRTREVFAHFPRWERVWLDQAGREVLSRLPTSDGYRGWCLVNGANRLPFSPSEDEALAHALLLRDVVLS